MPKVRGHVVQGEGEGRTTGYPTANLKLESASYRPHPGVYVAWVEGAAPERCLALLVSGVAWEEPGTPRIEVYLLDFNADLYGVSLTVELGRRLRDIERFGSRQELIRRIEADVATARKLGGPPRAKAH